VSDWRVAATSEKAEMPELTVPIRRLGVLVKVLLRGGGERPGGAAVGPRSAYLDTGAMGTMLDPGAIRSLGLRPLGSAALSVLGRADVSFHGTYRVQVALALPEGPAFWVPLDVVGGPVFRTGAVVALGRDFLSRFEFTYNGPGRQATLRW
jgi:hypothetical protein